MKNKRRLIIIPIILTIIKMIFYVPYKITIVSTENIPLQYKYSSILHTLKRFNECSGCSIYNIMLERYVIESLIIFFLSSFLVLFICWIIKIKKQ